jgi:hypothetical protein
MKEILATWSDMFLELRFARPILGSCRLEKSKRINIECLTNFLSKLVLISPA